MDDVDRCAADNAFHDGIALQNHLRRIRADQPPASECADCGAQIPAERREAMEKENMKCERCVACQSRFERSHRQWG